MNVGSSSSVWRRSWRHAQAFRKTDPDRIAAALLYTLERQEHNGHLCQHKEFFIRDAIHVLDTPELRRMEVAQHAFSMLKAGRLILYHDHVYRPVYAQAEQDVAQRIREMLTMNRLPYVADLDDEIDKEQAALGITLAPEQRQAVKTALSYPLCIISGGLGTGKNHAAEDPPQYLCQMVPPITRSSAVRLPAARRRGVQYRLPRHHGA